MGVAGLGGKAVKLLLGDVVPVTGQAEKKKHKEDEPQEHA